MLTRLWLRIAELSVTLLLALAVILAWREARNDRARLQSQLAAANQALAAASSRQQDRDAKLNDTLATIAAQKKATITPDQLLAGITTELGLPTPLVLQPQIAQPLNRAGKSAPNNSLQPPSASANAGTNDGANVTAGIQRDAKGAGSASTQIPSSNPSGAAANSSTQLPSAPTAQIPAADLKPLYDYILDCKACQAKLTAAQSDLADEKTKTATLTKSRDEAIKAAKGGSVLQRTARALKWLALGAAAGFLASKTHH